ncbi:MAG TPA: YciI family protein [Bacteroidia bacterium]|jgi:hypothetical protein|nr:YciI family protein [Bacteroidia bacterium]
MEKFLYLFRGGQTTDHNSSPEAMQAQMQKWMQWMEKLSKNGTMLGGEPLKPGGKQVNGTKKVVTDGPFVEAKETVGGYLLIQAKDINDAVEISKTCPIFEVDGKVEIRPLQTMEM